MIEWVSRLHEPYVIHIFEMKWLTSIQSVSETLWISFFVIVPITGFIRLEITVKRLDGSCPLMFRMVSRE